MQKITITSTDPFIANKKLHLANGFKGEHGIADIHEIEQGSEILFEWALSIPEGEPKIKFQQMVAKIKLLPKFNLMRIYLEKELNF